MWNLASNKRPEAPSTCAAHPDQGEVLQPQAAPQDRSAHRGVHVPMGMMVMVMVKVVLGARHDYATRGSSCSTSSGVPRTSVRPMPRITSLLIAPSCHSVAPLARQKMRRASGGAKMPAVGKTRSIQEANEHRRQAWAKLAPEYDKRIGFFERRVFGSDHRAWACSRATGETLEVAVGSGLNLGLYPAEIGLTGLDLSEEMLEIARHRAAELGRQVDLRIADAHELPFPDEKFDTVVCTYSLCNIPDHHRAVGEMKRVLRPGGNLVLVDHIQSGLRPVVWVQKAIEFFSIRSDGDHMTRRPLEQVKAHELNVIERERLGPTGIVERLVAVKAAGNG